MEFWLLTGKKFLEETARMKTTEGLDLSPSPASGNTSPLRLHSPPLWKGDSNAYLPKLLQE